MFSFSEFLIEARMAPLYHATRYGKEILEYDLLRAGHNVEPGLSAKTVSLTRSLVFAKIWLNEIGANAKTGIIFELDQQKLTQNYKIVPYNFFGNLPIKSPTRYLPYGITNSNKRDYNFGNQSEEAVLSDIKNIRKYITKVYIYSKEQVPDYIKGEKFPIYSYQDNKEINI